MRTLILGATLALLAGCGGEPEGPLTAEESDQLNEAAAMLDAAPDTILPANETASNDPASEAVNRQ